jgi:hypothetical protein
MRRVPGIRVRSGMVRLPDVFASHQRQRNRFDLEDSDLNKELARSIQYCKECLVV